MVHSFGAVLYRHSARCQFRCYMYVNYIWFALEIALPTEFSLKKKKKLHYDFNGIGKYVY